MKSNNEAHKKDNIASAKKPINFDCPSILWIGELFEI